MCEVQKKYIAVIEVDIKDGKTSRENFAAFWMKALTSFLLPLQFYINSVCIKEYE